MKLSLKYSGKFSHIHLNPENMNFNYNGIYREKKLSSKLVVGGCGLIITGFVQIAIPMAIQTLKNSNLWQLMIAYVLKDDI